jgi:hypothetical protein
MIYFVKKDGSIHGVDDGYDLSTVEGDFEVLKDFDVDVWKAEQQKVGVEESVKNVKDRYDRLVRNGWNEEDARIESGLDKIEDVK